MSTDITAPSTTDPNVIITDGTTLGTPEKPRRKPRRVFMWFFLALQLVFIAMIVAYGMESTGPSHADIVAGCYNGAWQGLFQSQQDCVVHYGHALNEAGHAGQGIGIALVIVLWAIVDTILGIGRFVVLTARKHKAS